MESDDVEEGRDLDKKGEKKEREMGKKGWYVSTEW